MLASLFFRKHRRCDTSPQTARARLRKTGRVALSARGNFRKESRLAREFSGSFTSGDKFVSRNECRLGFPIICFSLIKPGHPVRRTALAYRASD